MSETQLRLLRSHEVYLLLVILAVGILIQWRSGQFFTANNMVNLANAMVVRGIFAIGTHMALVSGGIDVSFPALASLSVYAVTSMLVDAQYQGSLLLPFVLIVGLGAVLGAFNGLFVSRLKVAVLIITLGTANVFSGIMQGVLSSVQLPQLPEAMAAFGNARIVTA